MWQCPEKELLPAPPLLPLPRPGAAGGQPSLHLLCPLPPPQQTLGHAQPTCPQPALGEARVGAGSGPGNREAGDQARVPQHGEGCRCASGRGRIANVLLLTRVAGIFHSGRPVRVFMGPPSYSAAVGGTEVIAE